MTVAQTKVQWNESLSQANEVLNNEKAIVLQLKKEIFALKEEIEVSGDAQTALQDALNEESNSVSITYWTISFSFSLFMYCVFIFITSMLSY